MKKVNIIGAGLAGSEAAWYLANKGISVNLYEQRPKKNTEAHKTEYFSELVCSNSLRSNDLHNAVGLLKKEMKDLNSLIIEAAYKTEVPAGGALAVDRDEFSKYITTKIKNHKNINVIYEEYKSIKENEYTIIATGPLTDGEFANSIKDFLKSDYLSFFDAAAPIVTKESLDLDKVYLKSRYDKGEASYLNAPMTEEEYKKFYNELINAKCIEPKDFEMKVFEGCMPVEVMAKRGEKTLLYGPLKPVGLAQSEDEKPYAVVQLRQDNAKKTLYNLVGFQTHMTFKEQKRILSLIPGLENVEIIRYGVMHRNSFIKSPLVLKNTYQSKKNEKIFFAGQITGVEGYVESAASGINAAINMERLITNKELISFPKTTAMGSLSNYITSTDADNFQPMNITFGIIEDLNLKLKKSLRKEAYAKRAQEDMTKFIEEKGLNGEI